MILGLTVILILVLFLPFTIKIVEKNLEVFLFFIMGIAAVIVSQSLDISLITKGLKRPNLYYVSCARCWVTFQMATESDGKRNPRNQ